MSQDDIAAAVNAALSLNWKEAEKLNQKILKATPDDIDCLNRLGKALLEQGEVKKATAIFRRVLKINKYDPIAQKNLDRASQTKPNHLRPAGPTGPRATTNFLEEPGKTKLVALVNIASAGNLLKQCYADVATLTPRRHTVVVEDSSGNYLGAMPDDLGHRLSILIKGGNTYQCFVKSVCKNSIIVFLRETCRAKKFASTPSFPVSLIGDDYLTSVREETLPADRPTKPANLTDDDSDDDAAPAKEDEEEATE